MSNPNTLWQPPFELLTPDRFTGPVLFGSPHSGRKYPREFLDQSRLDALTLRKSEDFHVDILFEGVQEYGAGLLRALFPRAYLDVNREPYELDPKMFAQALPPFANTASVRVAGGLGTIARIVADTQEIYRQRLNVSDAIRRIEQLYLPYHRAMDQTLKALFRAFDAAILVDCHSMPSMALQDENYLRPDFIVGDRYGTSCHAGLSDLAQGLLEDMGYNVQRNKPYAGGFITERYGSPGSGYHALQIEINRGLYMDEGKMVRSSGFDRIQADIGVFCAKFVEQAAAIVQPRRIAAE